MPAVCNKRKLPAARDIYATKWLWTYNNERFNMGIDGIAPRRKGKITNLGQQVIIFLKK